MSRCRGRLAAEGGREGRPGRLPVNVGHCPQAGPTRTRPSHDSVVTPASHARYGDRHRTSHNLAGGGGSGGSAGLGFEQVADSEQGQAGACHCSMHPIGSRARHRLPLHYHHHLLLLLHLALLLFLLLPPRLRLLPQGHPACAHARPVPSARPDPPAEKSTTRGRVVVVYLRRCPARLKQLSSRRAAFSTTLPSRTLNPSARARARAIFV